MAITRIFFNSPLRIQLKMAIDCCCGMHSHLHLILGDHQAGFLYKSSFHSQQTFSRYVDSMFLSRSSAMLCPIFPRSPVIIRSYLLRSASRSLCGLQWYLSAAGAIAAPILNGSDIPISTTANGSTGYLWSLTLLAYYYCSCSCNCPLGCWRFLCTVLGRIPILLFRSCVMA